MQAANAQLMSGRGGDGRLSHQLMARLAQHLLLRHPVAVKQGWVLEGWPRSLPAAGVMTSLVGAAGSSTASSSCAGGSSSDSPGGVATGGGKGGRRESMASAGFVKVRCCGWLLPAACVVSPYQRGLANWAMGLLRQCRVRDIQHSVTAAVTSERLSQSTVPLLPPTTNRTSASPPTTTAVVGRHRVGQQWWAQAHRSAAVVVVLHLWVLLLPPSCGGLGLTMRAATAAAVVVAALSPALPSKVLICCHTSL